jgi:signal transduction histidine kinase
METAVQEFAEGLARTLPVTVASVALWDQPSFALTVKAVGTSRPLPQPPRVGARIRLDRAPWYRAVLERQEPVLLGAEGQPSLSLESNGGDDLSLQSEYLVPIRIGGETIGVLCVGEMRSLTRESFTEQKRDRCRAILDAFVSSSAHAWEAGRLRRQTRAMSSLLRLAQDVMEARSADEVLASCVAEVSDWVGSPVMGILFRAHGDGGMEPVARLDLPKPFSDHDAAQLLLALVRTGGDERWPVSVVNVADDPLDPLNPTVRADQTWTRIGLPLLRAHRLQGIACLYVADDLRLSNWELEAFRRRGELVTLALGVVGALESQRTERRWFGRAAYQLLTEHQRTALSETVTRILDLVSTHLPPRLARLVPEPGSAAEEPEKSRPIAEVVTEAIQAVLGPIRQGVSLPGPLHMELLDVNGIVQRAIEIAHARWEQDRDEAFPAVRCRIEASAEPLLAYASISLVGAVVHAIENAVEAMPEGGEIHVRTGRDNGHALISVQDGGSGVPTLEDAFPPLASTKGNSYMGLGLSVLRSVVSRHGGTASVVSQEDGGALLEIRLPLRSESMGGRPMTELEDAEHVSTTGVRRTSQSAGNRRRHSEE